MSHDRRLTVGSLLPNQPRPVAVPKAPSVVQPSKQPLPEKAIIRLEQNGRSFSVRHVKGNLLTEGLSQGLPLQYKCRKGTCGVCTVKVTDGASRLSLPNQQEHKKLQGNIKSGFRLACQANME
ncbi:2Fe-2S iron-sulfur cluster-binding protein [Bacillus thermotolerans]|uniref:Ferredoxin n=1 Tax=Bacillus thermotolerans TaxID=1221996 RepID=FER_BACTR|nr:2Fe-2S iron-sulfur cluster-binding protein [Bacillus thermotolerans]A0A0F5HNC1.1 RecName: Full=Ferredoxin; AltName: Full=Fer cargo protein [Bacillus thermotolerans]KKB33988.1 hypothetical protein QY96_00285 [Bacillus thermotolerans]KKB34806.1 hypothetical protein QY97_02114 [Bacillus thermotolerans]KKB43346.1 hypothetical protein QY95_01591 [Bacillus thermotolerans]